jgi:hypothetical protein
MATVHSEKGFVFHVFPNDHQPAHVHVVKGGVEMRIDVSGDEPEPIALRGKERMSDKQINQALDIAEANYQKLQDGWKRFHDPSN